MKISKKAEKEILEVYNAYWHNYEQGNVEAMIPLVDDGYNQIGSAEAEVFFNKKDAVRFLRDTIAQVAGKAELRNRRIKVEPQKGICPDHRVDGFVCADRHGMVFLFQIQGIDPDAEKKGRVEDYTPAFFIS